MSNVPLEIAKIISEILSDSTQRTTSNPIRNEHIVVSLLSENYNKYRFIVMADPSYIYTRMKIVKDILGNSAEKKFQLLADKLSNLGLRFDVKNPYDKIRIVLDSLIYACLYGARYDPYEILEGIKVKVKSKYKGNEVNLSFKSICSLLRYIDTFLATTAKFHYSGDIWDLVYDINNHCNFMKIYSPEDFIDAYKVRDKGLEEFREYLTYYITPSFKSLFTLLNLSKYKYSLIELVLGGLAGKRKGTKKGIMAKKDLYLTYLGRITSELIDSMIYGHWSKDVLIAYDSLVKMYFNILKSIGDSVENNEEYNYLEFHPAFDTYYATIEKILTETDPFTSHYFRKRGLISTGEIIKDVKTYLSAIYYYKSTYPQYFKSTNIKNYDIVELVLNARLKRK